MNTNKQVVTQMRSNFDTLHDHLRARGKGKYSKENLSSMISH